jgi:hypothetical protein
MKRKLIVSFVIWLFLALVLVGQKKTQKSDNAAINALINSLNQLIGSASFEVSSIGDMRIAAPSAKVSSGNAEMLVKKEKLKWEINDLKDHLGSSWSSFSSYFNRAVSGASSGQPVIDNKYAEALEKCRLVMDDLQSLHVKVAAQQKESSSAARLSSDSLQSINMQLVSIQEGAIKMRDALSSQLMHQMDQNALLIPIGSSSGIFRLEESQLTVANSATSIQPVVVYITNGNISRINLVDALKAVGFAENQILANISSIIESLMTRFSVNVV